jgi:hypothetical protein
MSYTKFQFITLETPTGAPVTPVNMSTTDYVATVAKATGYDLSKLGDDAKNRLNWIRQAVDEALNSKGIGDKDTLKIFAAPEFFFRPETSDEEIKLKLPNRAYSYDARRKIHQFFEHLFRDDNLKDWLIIPGTVLGHETSDPQSTTPNRAYVIRGGMPALGQTPILSIHAKFNTPETDEIPKKRLWTGLPANAKWSTTGEQYKLQVSTLKQALTNIITVDGVRIGIDLCMDHGCQILFRTCVMMGGDSKPEAVHLQLLVACGKPATAEAVATVEGGFLLRVDGATKVLPHSQVLKVTQVDWDNRGSGSSYSPDLKTGKYQYVDSVVSRRGFQPTINKADAPYDECLRIYEPMVFPKE